MLLCKTGLVDPGYPCRVCLNRSTRETFLKTLAAIRLVLATALIVLFSGTMAFAHEGHHHGVQVDKASGASAPVVSAKFDGAWATQLSSPGFSGGLIDGIVTVSSAPSSAADCDHGCCCCGSGASACGMSGCSALGLSLVEEFVPRPSNSGKLAFNIADVLVGRSDSGLDRPPKV